MFTEALRSQAVTVQTILSVQASLDPVSHDLRVHHLHCKRDVDTHATLIEDDSHKRDNVTRRRTHRVDESCSLSGRDSGDLHHADKLHGAGVEG